MTGAVACGCGFVESRIASGDNRGTRGSFRAGCVHAGWRLGIECGVVHVGGGVDGLGGAEMVLPPGSAELVTAAGWASSAALAKALAPDSAERAAATGRAGSAGRAESWYDILSSKKKGAVEITDAWYGVRAFR